VTSNVLYRKWRPSKFSNIVGQEPIIQTLTQAIATNRTSHAYLLCGPRGTGKTSTARILAKALNCTMRPPGIGDPCGACPNCSAIETGNFIDVIEVDAASNRRIEEMRELREKVRFSPTAGKYKVYIIDEVHQLTDAASEAFLKTLEEPPPQTVFILATTEPHKLSATILSRCQRFDFRKISGADMASQLKEIATQEEVEIPSEVLRMISQTAKGSLRDGTNVLEQLITSYGSSIRVENARDFLGIHGEDRAIVFVKHLLTGATTQALETINTVSSEGYDLRGFQQIIINMLRAALLEKTGITNAMDFSGDIASQISFLASSIPLPKIMRSLRLFNQFKHDDSMPGPILFELAIVELEIGSSELPPISPDTSTPQSTARIVPSKEQIPTSSQTIPTNQTTRPSTSSNFNHRDIANAQAPPSLRPPHTMPTTRTDTEWKNFVNALRVRVPKKQFDVAALVRSAKSHALDDSILTITFSTKSNSERLEKELDHPPSRIEVEKILEEIYGKPVTLKIESANTTSPNQIKGEDSHLVRTAVNLYQGHVVSKNTVDIHPSQVATEDQAYMPDTIENPPESEDLPNE